VANTKASNIGFFINLAQTQESKNIKSL
jgi:hypothetical protein